ncbi:MAG: CPBP family intramembrane glutamic endopeptidase [Pseudobdellovibrio sp.]
MLKNYISVKRPNPSEIALLFIIVFGFFASQFWKWPVEIILTVYFALCAFSYFYAPLKPAFLPLLVVSTAKLTTALIYPFPFISAWPINLYIVGFVSYLVLKKIGPVDFSSRWSLKFSKQEWLSAAVIFVLSVTCLSVYFFNFRDVAQKFSLPAAVPPWAVPLTVILMAFINGIREEFVYRIVFQKTFLKSLSLSWSVILQALAFGLLHFEKGFPQGWIGVGLTFCFGLLMGAQYYWSRSAALAWLTHSVVDAAMFGIILLNQNP